MGQSMWQSSGGARLNEAMMRPGAHPERVQLRSIREPANCKKDHS
jgi:hypothetical protein